MEGRKKQQLQKKNFNRKPQNEYEKDTGMGNTRKPHQKWYT